MLVNGQSVVLAARLDAALTEIGNLTAALQSNRLIGVAIGILMERHKITADEAFARLVRASQCTNRKLRDVASELCYSGLESPGPAPAPPRGGQCARPPGPNASAVADTREMAGASSGLADPGGGRR